MTATATNRPRAARNVWRSGVFILVSFPTLGRAFRALAKLQEAGRACEYDGRTANGRHWVRLCRA